MARTTTISHARTGNLISFGVCLLVLLATPGCAVPVAQVPIEHIVMINERGNLLDPTGNSDCRDEASPQGGLPLCNGGHVVGPWNQYHELAHTVYQPYFDRVFAAIKDYPERGGKKKILIFVHGGLNKQAETIERVLQLQKELSDRGYYAIFINWPSSLFYSYLDHLFDVRQGEAWGMGGYALAPFYLGVDLARGIARAPLLWVFGGWEGIKAWFGVRSEEQDEARRIAQSLQHDAPQTVFNIDDCRTTAEATTQFVTGILTIPSKMLIAPFLDVFGKSAWDNMLRRTHMLYQTDREFARSDTVIHDQDPAAPDISRIHNDGALSAFMQRLQKEAIQAKRDNGGTDKWDITLVGHSMGTIVLNELIRRFGEVCAPPCQGPGDRHVMPFNQIVYMAGAATIRDYEISLFPYLKHNTNAHMFHLILHEKAEVGEQVPILPVYDLPPRGSLLVWIDDFLSSPDTPLDRTMGRFVNLMPAVHDIPEGLRARIHITAFGVGKRLHEPQRHGDFTENLMMWELGEQHPVPVQGCPQ